MFWRKKKEIRDAKTIEKCTTCGNEHKRDFVLGDVLFSDGKPCNLCKNSTRIDRIYGQIRDTS
ncbi:MAG: hypothetical protein K8823_1197 [Cenarchaeum symbiont of Oopsacas minuta]|nr:hypothetical protein [Cenarchaeum symbiont of Oopsacas minuta]